MLADTSASDMRLGLGLGMGFCGQDNSSGEGNGVIIHHAINQYSLPRLKWPSLVCVNRRSQRDSMGVGWRWLLIVRAIKLL